MRSPTSAAGGDRQHAAAPGEQPGDRLAAQRDDPRRVVQRQRAGDAGGGDLALGVPDDRVRLDARASATARPVTTITAHSAGWTTSDPVQARCAGLVPRAPRTATSRCTAERPLTGGDLLGEHRRGLQQLHAPCRPTASPGRGRRRPSGPARRRWPATTPAAGSPSASAASAAQQRPSRSSAGDRGAVLEARPVRGQSGRDVGRRRLGLGGEVPARRRPARAAPASVCAESTHGTGRGRLGAGCGRRAADRRSRPACSRMTCALVPLMPNEETPARRGRSGRPARARPR